MQQEKLIVGQRSYHAVRSELRLLEIIAYYLAFVDVAPSLTVEACHRVVEVIKARILLLKPSITPNCLSDLCTFLPLERPRTFGIHLV